MTNQQYSVHLSIASSSEIEHTALRLKTTREEFLATGIPASASPTPDDPGILALLPDYAGEPLPALCATRCHP